jgi:putative transposase
MRRTSLYLWVVGKISPTRDFTWVEQEINNPYRAVRYGIEEKAMANTYSQIHIQVVFAVQNRVSLIGNDWKDELYKYITGVIQNHDHKVLQINGMPDHIHILIGLRPTQALANLMKMVKQDSSKWINLKGFVKGKFSWQAGYGAFSYSKEQIPRVINYIQNQVKHHSKKSFLKEYEELLKTHEIEYDQRYIFKPIE